MSRRGSGNPGCFSSGTYLKSLRANGYSFPSWQVTLDTNRIPQTGNGSALPTLAQILATNSPISAQNPVHKPIHTARYTVSERPRRKLYLFAPCERENCLNIRFF